MSKEEQKQAVLAAQIALGENYSAPFWNDVETELNALETGKSKSKLQVRPRLTLSARTRHY